MHLLGTLSLSSNTHPLLSSLPLSYSLSLSLSLSLTHSLALSLSLSLSLPLSLSLIPAFQDLTRQHQRVTHQAEEEGGEERGARAGFFSFLDGNHTLP